MDFRNHFLYTRCEVFGSVMLYLQLILKNFPAYMSDNHTGRHLRITISISPQLQTQMAPCPTSSSLCCLIQLKATASERKTRKEESKKEEKEENKSSKLQ